jgi:soluble lytic murein transglycosylase-like protein
VSKVEPKVEKVAAVVKPEVVENSDDCPLPEKVDFQEYGNLTDALWINVRSYCEMIQDNCLNEYKNLDINLVAAVMMKESKGNPNAVSKSDAIGLMQVVPMQGRLSRSELFDPKSNIHEGCKILSRYIETYGSEKEGLWAYYGKNKPFSAYADPIEKMIEDIKAAKN